MPCSERLKFAHQFFPDGSIDSICARCSVTVASVANEADLVLKEGQHVCDPFLLAHYEFFKKCPVLRRFPSTLAATKSFVYERNVPNPIPFRLMAIGVYFSRQHKSWPFKRLAMRVALRMREAL